MSDYIVIRKVKLTPKHQSTGKTHNIVCGKKISMPIELHIVKYPNIEGVYLLYLGKNDEELTDTFHETLHSAMSQAEWEFGIKNNDWNKEDAGNVDV